MNNCLAGIGIHVPARHALAIAVGGKFGAYRDYPASKGYTSPFAPDCVNVTGFDGGALKNDLRHSSDETCSVALSSIV